MDMKVKITLQSQGISKRIKWTETELVKMAETNRAQLGWSH